LILASKFK